MKNNQSAMALVMVIMFILLLSLMAVALLTLMSSQASLSESQIRRIRAQYTAESAAMRGIMNVLGGGTVQDLDENGFHAAVTQTIGVGINGTADINAVVAYYQ